MYRLITSVICGLVTIGTVVHADPTRPKLVVGIVVDQLRTDYLEYLQSLFGEKGFKKLMNEGAYLRNVDFNLLNPDVASATATIYTGSTPARSGVPSATVYDETSRKAQPVLIDESGVYSPQAMRLSTISDEIAVDGAGLGLVYSLSTDPQQAVIMSGHAGSSAYWINDNNGRWTTSPYYKEKVALMTGKSPIVNIDQRIDTMQWKPSISLDRYPGVPSQKRYYPFRHTFPRSDREIYRRFNATPLANREITDVAIEYLRRSHLGSRGDAIDMLNIGYTAAPYPYIKDGDPRVELQDAYLRLDGDIGRLFDAIDECVGLENTLIYLSSTGYYRETTSDDEKYRIPTGTFSARRALSLLNSYLSARFGMGEYLAGYHNGHFYFNDRTIDDLRLDRKEVVDEAALFLSKMSGIAETYTQLEIVNSQGDEGDRLRNSIDITRAGDVVVTFVPGWTVIDDTVYPEQKSVARDAVVATPFFLLYPEVEPQIISYPVDASILAPTVTQTLRIRSPNGAKSRPMLLTSPQSK